MFLVPLDRALGWYFFSIIYFFGIDFTQNFSVFFFCYYNRSREKQNSIEIDSGNLRK